MIRTLCALLLLLIASTGGAYAAAPSEEDPKKLVTEAKPVPLPPGIKWETNDDEPLIVAGEGNGRRSARRGQGG